ncbi:hypothetical protein HYPSUDRAFT_40196 [Hypholoma sublateritium FD-334 SS-4]|uniref:F-box domain-containing protein n=1 Tax=Hypholoma sublateritium (strain FD-334 SS-4) TaxID=945553 RepID=A0A0D2PTU2_HYPSF|nr:hypothetical protein HYPSUDRAFT_40196 [Hypholoma sublateritium FD-334 SS-4]
MQVSTIATELVLHFFSFMNLKTLIAAQGVCQEWRRLVPLADIHPDRRRLLHLFHNVVSDERFLLYEKLQISFVDRQAYIDQLLQQYPKVPDTFKLWILEWPSRIVIQGLSPFDSLQEAKYDSFNRRNGVNWIALNPPQILTLVYSPGADKGGFEVIPALLAFRSQSLTAWIIFDDRPELSGRVYTSYDYVDFVDTELADTTELGALHPDWIAYISFLWKKQAESWHPNGVDRGYRPPKPINTSRITYFGFRRLRDLPTPRWTRRHEPRSQEYMRPDWQRPFDLIRVLQIIPGSGD